MTIRCLIKSPAQVQCGSLRVDARRGIGEWLEMSVCDDGPGVPATEVKQVFFAVRPRVHALALLRRRLEGLFGPSFRWEVISDLDQGTPVTIRVPLRGRFAMVEEPLGAITTDAGHLVSR
jgi:sensor histidine kinase YesM